MRRKLGVLISIGLYVALATYAWAQQAALPPISAEEAALHIQLGQTEFLLGRRMMEVLQLQQQLDERKAKLPADPPPIVDAPPKPK